MAEAGGCKCSAAFRNEVTMGMFKLILPISSFLRSYASVFLASLQLMNIVLLVGIMWNLKKR